MTRSAAPRPADALGGELVRGVAANVGGRLLSMAAWLLVTPLVLKALGATRFGLWTLVSTVAGFSLALDLGLSAAVTRFLASHRATGDDEGMRGALSLGVLGSVTLGLVWLLVVMLAPGPLLDLVRVEPALRPEAIAMLWVMGAAFLLNLVALSLSSALAGFQRFDLVSRNLIASTLVQLSGMLLAVTRGGGLRELAAAAVAGAATSLALSWLSLRSVWKSVGPSRFETLGRALREFGDFGAALQIITLGSLVLYQLPKFYFARLASLAAVGQYELGFRVAFSAWSLPSLLLPPLLPAASQLESTGERERLVRLYARASRYLLALALPLAAALVALAGPLYSVWLGPGHAAEARANAAIAALLGVNVLTSVGSLLARGMGRPWWEAGYLLLAVGLQLAIGPALVRARGFDGGLAAMLVSGALGTLWFMVVFHRAIGEPLGAFLWRVVAAPLFAAVLGGVAAWAASGAPWGDPATWPRAQALLALARGGIVFAAVAAGALFATRALTGAELLDLAARLRARPARAAGDA